jgi:uncharacterized protein (DUF2126 family)
MLKNLQLNLQTFRIDTKNVTPTYEDPIYWALEEGKLPVNIDPLKVN